MLVYITFLLQVELFQVIQAVITQHIDYVFVGIQDFAGRIDDVYPCQAIVNQFFEYGAGLLQALKFGKQKFKKYSSLIDPGWFIFLRMFIDWHKNTMNNLDMMTKGEYSGG